MNSLKHFVLTLGACFAVPTYFMVAAPYAAERNRQTVAYVMEEPGSGKPFDDGAFKGLSYPSAFAGDRKRGEQIYSREGCAQCQCGVGAMDDRLVQSSTDPPRCRSRTQESPDRRLCAGLLDGGNECKCAVLQPAEFVVSPGRWLAAGDSPWVETLGRLLGHYLGSPPVAPSDVAHQLVERPLGTGRHRSRQIRVTKEVGERVVLSDQGISGMHASDFTLQGWSVVAVSSTLPLSHLSWWSRIRLRSRWIRQTSTPVRLSMTASPREQEPASAVRSEPESLTSWTWRPGI